MQPEDRVLLRTPDVYQTEAQDDIGAYSDRLLSIVADFRNSGEPEGANAQSMVGKSKRGEVACRLFARIDPATGIIEAAGFKSRGCLAMTACASAACLLIEGKGIEQALDVDIEDIREFVGGVPAGKVNALHFATCAVRALVGDMLLRDGARLTELDEAVPCDEGSISCMMAEHCSLRQSRLECRMEEEEAQRARAENDACAAALDIVRTNAARSAITPFEELRSLAPAHLSSHGFRDLLLGMLEADAGADVSDLSPSAVRSKATPRKTAAAPSPFANRGVGIPNLFGEKPAPNPCEPIAHRALPIEPDPPVEDDELVAPEGFELVEIDGQWALAPCAGASQPPSRIADPSGIAAMVGAKDAYLYDSARMKPAYARWAFLAQEDDPLTTFAYCVREDSRVYPRPLAESSLMNDPFNMSPKAVRAAFAEAQSAPAFSDIERTQASNGDIYYYSADHLSAEHARALAEWESVERLRNV